MPGLTIITDFNEERNNSQYFVHFQVSQHVFTVLRAAENAFEEACACQTDTTLVSNVKTESYSEDNQAVLSARLVHAARMIFELYR